MAKYKRVYDPSHPNSYSDGHIMEHRLVMSNKLGRPLLPSEHVHHIDGDKTNNSPDNLEIVNKSEHHRSHYPDYSEALIESSKTPESIIKRKETFKRNKHQQGKTNSQFGTMWITNGKKNSKINKSDPIPEGFWKGRKIK